MLGGFIAECCDVNSAYRVKAGTLYASYKAWAEAGNEYAMNQRRFGSAMTERGFQRDKSGCWWYLGIDLVNQ